MSGIFIFSHLLKSKKPSPFIVGVTAGPHALIAENVKKIAQNKGFTFQIIEFNDFMLPNLALEQKDIHLNSYQHQPFLQEQINARNYAFQMAGKTVFMPLGLYSKKHHHLEKIPEGGKVAIPNDPTNLSRALFLLRKEGLITLSSNESPSVMDIKDNPKQLKFIEIDAPQLPRALEDCDIAVINVDWILLAGLEPKDALATESIDSPYVNILVIRKEEENHPDIKKFIEFYQSQENKKFVLETFKGAVIPAW